MADPVLNRDSDLDDPAWDAASVSPNNSADLPKAPTRGVYVGGAGDVSVVMAGGTQVTFVGAQAGSILPIRVDRVRSTDTTATDILALY